MILKIVANICLLTLLGAACADSNEAAQSSEVGAPAATSTRIDDSSTPPAGNGGPDTDPASVQPPGDTNSSSTASSEGDETGADAASGETGLGGGVHSVVGDETGTDAASEGANQVETAGGSLTSRFEEEIDKLVEAAERVRGLDFLEPPNVVLLSSEDFNRRLQDTLEENLQDIEVGGELYKLLGLLDKEDSLKDLYREIFSSAIAGYYDGDTTELIVPIRGNEITSYDRVILIHELVHALTDQHFKFSELADQLDDEDKDDAMTALRALVEGDARRMEERYVESELSYEEQFELATTTIDELLGVEESDSPTRREFPHFLVEAISFPYSFGFPFVRQISGLGGLEAINAAYKNPPISTEQIHSPSNYPDEVPLEVSHPAVDIPGYELEHSSTWGEAGFAIMFDQALGIQSFANSQNRREAVKGWGGDRYSLWSNGEETAFALTYRGDEAADASELFETMQEYVSVSMDVGAPEVSEDKATWRGEDFAWLHLSGDTLRFIAASDPEVGGYLATAYGDLGMTAEIAAPSSLPSGTAQPVHADTSNSDSSQLSASLPESDTDLPVGEAAVSLTANFEAEGTLAASHANLSTQPASLYGEPPTLPAGSSTENTESDSPNEASQQDEPAETSETDEPAETDEPDENLRALFETQIAELIETTERIRGLEFLEAPNITLLTVDAFRERVQGAAQQSFAGQEDEEALLKLLGLLDRNASLAQLQQNLFTGSVAGFYSSANGELVVPIRGDELEVYDRIILFHELIHALTDQHFNFWDRIIKLARETKYDEGRAMRALIEGDASIFQTYYIANELTSADLVELNNTLRAARSNAVDLSGIPHFIREAFNFQYSAGRIFVNNILNNGGLRAVDAAYKSPPITTEQIFFPQKYPDDIPLDIDHPEVDLPGYRLVDSSTWGALNLSMMFDQVFAPWETGGPGTGHTRKAVEGWGSDAYSLWFNDNDAVFTLTYRGDTLKDAEEFAYIMRDYIPIAMAVGNPYISGNTTTWQAEDFAWLSISGDEVQFVAASDPEVADIILTAYETP